MLDYLGAFTQAAKLAGFYPRGFAQRGFCPTTAGFVRGYVFALFFSPKSGKTHANQERAFEKKKNA